MKKIELLAPAKDIVKAKVAIDYGADAVYIGGKSFSLRSRASNFSLDDIYEAVEYAHKRNAKIYVTVNMVFHEENIKGIEEYFNQLEKLKVDGIIVSSVWLLELAKTIIPKVERHISTQLSCTNSQAANYYKENGADRVILARECSINEIKSICNNSEVPIEVFIHGGMCSNYSGRCTLSNRMTNRDANRGGCAHSCRWKYKVYDHNVLISDEKTLFSMSSKDLRASNYIEELMNAGVTSLKIEGRMKSEYYNAQVVKTYRKMIDEIYTIGHLDEDRIAYYDSELDKAENRPSDDGFLSGNCDNSKNLYGVNGAGVTHDYVALVKNYDPKRGLALIEVKNIFKANDKLEVFGPTIDNEEFEAKMMFDIDWNKVEVASKPTELLYIRIPFEVKKNDMLRKTHNEN